MSHGGQWTLLGLARARRARGSGLPAHVDRSAVRRATADVGTAAPDGSNGEMAVGRREAAAVHRGGCAPRVSGIVPDPPSRDRRAPWSTAGGDTARMLARGRPLARRG